MNDGTIFEMPKYLVPSTYNSAKLYYKVGTYESDYSVRGDNGIKQGYQRLVVTKVENNVATMHYEETLGENEIIYESSEFTVSADEKHAEVTWIDPFGSEYSAKIDVDEDHIDVDFDADKYNGKSMISSQSSYYYVEN